MKTIYLYPLNITATPCEYGTFVYGEFIDDISGVMIYLTGTRKEYLLKMTSVNIQCIWAAIMNLHMGMMT